MTTDEALSVMHRMMATWPTPPMSVDTARVWLDYLRPQNAEIVTTALDALTRHEQRIPTIATMQTALRAAHHHTQLADNTQRALAPADRASPEVATRNLAELRTLLAAVGNPTPAAPHRRQPR